MSMADRELFADDAESEGRVNRAAEEDQFFKTLLEEVFNLEPEHEQFNAAARVLREEKPSHE